MSAKNCTKNRTSKTEFIHSPREGRGQASREMSVKLGLLRVLKAVRGLHLRAWGECGEGSTLASRTGGRRLFKGLCVGLVGDVVVVRLEKNMLCLLFENVQDRDLEKQKT